MLESAVPGDAAAEHEKCFADLVAALVRCTRTDAARRRIACSRLTTPKLKRLDDEFDQVPFSQLRAAVFEPQPETTVREEADVPHKVQFGQGPAERRWHDIDVYLPPAVKEARRFLYHLGLLIRVWHGPGDDR